MVHFKRKIKFSQQKKLLFRYGKRALIVVLLCHPALPAVMKPQAAEKYPCTDSGHDNRAGCIIICFVDTAYPETDNSQRGNNNAGAHYNV